MGLLLSQARVAEWQTQRTQNPPRATSCEFDSRLGHVAAQSLTGFLVASFPAPSPVGIGAENIESGNPDARGAAARRRPVAIATLTSACASRPQKSRRRHFGPTTLISHLGACPGSADTAAEYRATLGSIVALPGLRPLAASPMGSQGAAQIVAIQASERSVGCCPQRAAASSPQPPPH